MFPGSGNAIINGLLKSHKDMDEEIYKQFRDETLILLEEKKEIDFFIFLDLMKQRFLELGPNRGWYIMRAKIAMEAEKLIYHDKKTRAITLKKRSRKDEWKWLQ
jgi:hypothetical protein